jgi:hypothetical protein
MPTTSTVRDDIIKRRLERVVSPEHILDVLTELAARARRRDHNSQFQSGMYTAYVQAIQLLLDCTYDEAHALVEDGFL